MPALIPFPPSQRKRTVAQALNDMLIEPGIDEVVIIGIKREPQEEYVLMSSEMTAADLNWALDRVKQMVLE